MSTPRLVAAETGTETAAGARPAGPHPVALGVGSALLLWSAFPPARWGWLAWLALVPLFLLVTSRRSRLAVYAGAWAGGMVFWTLAVSWVRLADESAWLAWLVMAAALSVFWPAFLLLARMAVGRLRLPTMVALPVVWVALEYVRAFVVTGFPWYYLAHTQHDVLPLIQVADLSGSLGVSFLVALVNAWLVDLLTRPLLRSTPRGPRLTPAQGFRLGVVAAALGSTLAYGGYRLSTAKFRPGPRVALLQTNLIQRYRSSRTSAELLNVYRDLVARAAKAAERPDLIVWPETSYPYQFQVFDPKLTAEALAGQLKILDFEFTPARWIARGEQNAKFLHKWTDEVGIPMLIGSVTYDHRPAGFSRYNSALLFEPGKAGVQRFYKIHLVPFGEYVPLIATFPWLVRLTPYRGTHVPSLTFGTDPVWLKLGPYSLATAICFEDTVPHVVRRFFDEAEGGRQPDVLLNMSNDGWFRGSSEHDMHLAVSVFRAVENRVPLARAANTGVSAIIDGNGRVLSALPKLKEDILFGVLPLDDRTGPYSRWGDWLGRSCLAVTIGLVPLAFVYPGYRARRKSRAL